MFLVHSAQRLALHSCSFRVTNGHLLSAHALYHKSVRTHPFGLYLICKHSTLGPAALGCCVYKSDTNLMGVLQLLHTYTVSQQNFNIGESNICDQIYKNPICLCKPNRTVEYNKRNGWNMYLQNPNKIL